MLPFLEVAHLPSSSSFYSAIIQPLGLRYLSAEDGHFPSIIYGDALGGVPIFQLRQIRPSRDRPLKPSHLVVSAPSPEAAEDAYDCAVRANPDNRDRPRQPRGSHEAVSGASATRTLGGGGKIRINITDFDGNNMEVVYRPPSKYPDYYGGSTVRHTQSTPKEASRILEWNYDVVSADIPPPSARASAASRRPQAGYGGEDAPYSSLRRSITDGLSSYEPASPRQNSSGLSASTVVGTLLGVAAGAALGGALTYSRVKADRGRAPRQEYDEPPAFSRRSTFPDPYPTRNSQYVEVEREVAKVRYPEDYVADRRPAPEYIARYSQVGDSRSREVEDIEDKRSRYESSRSRASGRTRSEAATNRQPLLLDEPERRSHVSSRSSRHPPIVQRSYTYEEPERERERESYVSAKSHYSSSTARGPPLPGQPQQMVSRSRSGSRVTTTTVKVGGNSGSRPATYVSARGVPLPPSEYSARKVPLPPSEYSARHIPLPPSEYSARGIPLPSSGVGSSHAGWADDDADSVAPSDSISCVGTERSRRSRSYR